MDHVQKNDIHNPIDLTQVKAKSSSLGLAFCESFYIMNAQL